jgi:hypothetical protein
MKKIMIAGLAILCAGLSSAERLLLQQDFNTMNGEPSLFDPAKGKDWAMTGEPKLKSDDLTPVSKGGCAGWVKNDGLEKQNFQTQAKINIPLKSMTAGGWIKVGQPIYTTGWILNNQMTIERKGFSLMVMSNDLKIAFAVNAYVKVTDYAITPDVWTFVAVTYDATQNQGNVKVYVSTDGKTLSLVQTLTHNRPGVVDPSTTNIRTGNFFSTGLFDSCRVYGSEKDDTGALSEDEIKAWMEYSDTGAKPIILGAYFPSRVDFAEYRNRI